MNTERVDREAAVAFGIRDDEGCRLLGAYIIAVVPSAKLITPVSILTIL